MPTINSAMIKIKKKVLERNTRTKSCAVHQDRIELDSFSTF